MNTTFRPRARDLGIRPGTLPTGAFNAITDVPGVRVGQVTLHSDNPAVHTGVTVIIPAPGDLFQRKFVAAVHTINGFGKATGFEQVREMGTLETPIALTNTLCVGRAWDALATWTIQKPSPEEIESVNPLVGECNDAFLNEPHLRSVQAEHVLEALRNAAGGVVEEGAVGAGSGMVCYDFKGGVGTASRKVGAYTLGALVVTNFGSRSQLTVLGVPVGRMLEDWPETGRESQGSVMVVLATDAPLLDRQLGRVARRAALGLGRTGTIGGSGSGDFVIAFTTALRVRNNSTQSTVRVEHLPEGTMNDYFQAAIEAVEEAVLNSLCAAVSVQGRLGRVIHAIPLKRLARIMQQFGHIEVALPEHFPNEVE